jgi:hypothetical protein
MWYEAEMLNETLDSLQNALRYSTQPTEIRVCINTQTYLEEPIEGTPEDMVGKFIHHSVLKNANIIRKTNNDPFYNIADWRRDHYNKEGVTYWGESDCLIPEEYFYTVEILNITHPHFLAFSSRKMWEPSWIKVEHQDLKNLPHKKGKSAETPFNWDDRIEFDELKRFNRKQKKIRVLKLDAPKIDGSLIVLSPGLPRFIPDKMHFVEEDACAQFSFEKNHIPQYLVSNILKGHNYKHPLKRTNTLATRDDSLYQKYKAEALKIRAEFIPPSFNYTRRLKWSYVKGMTTRQYNKLRRKLNLNPMDYKQGSLFAEIPMPEYVD